MDSSSTPPGSSNGCLPYYAKTVSLIARPPASKNWHYTLKCSKCGFLVIDGYLACVASGHLTCIDCVNKYDSKLHCEFLPPKGVVPKTIDLEMAFSGLVFGPPNDLAPKEDIIRCHTDDELPPKVGRCGSPLIFQPNELISKLQMKILLSCPYEAEGCWNNFPASEMRHHYTNVCKSRPFGLSHGEPATNRPRSPRAKTLTFLDSKKKTGNTEVADNQTWSMSGSNRYPEPLLSNKMTEDRMEEEEVSQNNTLESESELSSGEICEEDTDTDILLHEETASGVSSEELREEEVAVDRSLNLQEEEVLSCEKSRTESVKMVTTFLLPVNSREMCNEEELDERLGSMVQPQCNNLVDKHANNPANIIQRIVNNFALLEEMASSTETRKEQVTVAISLQQEEEAGVTSEEMRQEKEAEIEATSNIALEVDIGHDLQVLSSKGEAVDSRPDAEIASDPATEPTQDDNFVDVYEIDATDPCNIIQRTVSLRMHDFFLQ